MADAASPSSHSAATRHAVLAAAIAANAHASTSMRTMPSHAKYLGRPPPLASVLAACSARPELDALVPAISAFIDTNGQHWTIERASKLGHLHLLRRLVAYELPGNTHPRYRSHVFSRSAVHAVRHGSFEMLECLRTYCPDGLASKALEQAAVQGRVDLLDWLAAHCRNIVWSRAFAVAAARGGHVHALQWLRAHSPDPAELLVGAVAPAVARGHLKMLQWLLDAHGGGDVLRCIRSPQEQHDLLCSAAAGGHLAVLQCLYDICGFRFTDPGAGAAASAASAAYPIDVAATSGSLETVQWLHARGYVAYSKRAIANAAPNGHAHVVHWLLEHAPAATGAESASLFDAVDCARAATNGHLEVAQQLYHRAQPPMQFRDDVLAMTAENGHLEVAKWLVAVVTGGSACEPSTLNTLYRRMMWAAATHGHLAIVKWLYRSLRHFALTPEGLEEDAMSGAAYGGHHAVLAWLYARWPGDRRPVFYVYSVAGKRDVALVKWLVDNSDALVNSTAIEAAASSGDMDMLLYLRELTSVCDARFAMRAAAASNQLGVVQWLAANGAPRDHALKGAVESNRVRVAKWLVATAPSPSQDQPIDALSKAVSLEMVQWLLTVLPDGDVSSTMLAAAQRGDLDTLLLLHEVRGARCSVHVAAAAVVHDHVELFEWLLETFPHEITLDAVHRSIDASGLTAAYLPGIEARMRPRVVTIRLHR